ncbi:MAG: type IV secretion system DNA-binding domain-containing protein [Candidatus Magasanikbacteria bacterium]|nr:type IV secretion system DNA-binding domain-containing protein [Candidatus Magasanikbacteria bacterium]
MIYSSPDINVFGQTDFRNLNKRFGIKLDDRRRHMYIIGKTGMGKSTMLENMIINDIQAGHGLALIDPHGDMAEKVIDFVPPERIKDVVYFNPADTDFPLGFNILESVSADHRHLVASGLMGVFKKIWPDVWSARMEYILNNTILSLLECNDTTLLAINRLLADAKYRKNMMTRVTDPVVKAFWVNEFDKYDEKYRREAVAPIQNKIGQFLSAAIVRNIVAQRKSTFNVRELMDTKKIFVVNLSKGRIGEDASRLLGGMLITKIQLSAMERVDTIEKVRKDF